MTEATKSVGGSTDPLVWLLWVAVGALVVLIGTYIVGAIYRRPPVEPSGLFFIPEPGAEPVEAAWVMYLGRESGGPGHHVFLACFPVWPVPETRWEVKVGHLPNRTRLRFMLGTEESALGPGDDALRWRLGDNL